MQIQVIGISNPEWKEKGKSKWQEIVVTYSAAGKTSTKKFLSFDPIFTTAKEMDSGAQYDITMTKDGEYWKWTEIVKAGVGNQGASEPAKQYSHPSTYETPEERAKKQIFIVRQSSIANALEYSKSVKALKSVEEVIDIAKKFEEFVFFEDAMEGIINMEDDIPV